MKMKMNVLYPKYFLVLLIGLSTSPLFEQTDGALEIANVKTHIINSIHNEKEYRLQVLLPTGYSTANTIRYPVLYALDGKYSTTLFYSIVETFALAKELKDIIIVTIDSNVQTEREWQTSRYHDYTPSFNPQADTAIAKFFKLPISTSGGAAAFLSTLENEIIPLIEQQYKTSYERGLYGHSLGGLFAGFCLTTKPNLFQKILYQ